jgi:hypothetical protein
MPERTPSLVRTTEARDAIDRIAQRRQEAIATLHGMGYRARFARP